VRARLSNHPGETTQHLLQAGRRFLGAVEIGNTFLSALRVQTVVRAAKSRRNVRDVFSAFRGLGPLHR
jgi:hypothetical protein